MLYTKPKVFVSSTVYDLPEERKSAFDTITSVGCEPLMSEFTMEAVDENSVTACLNKVRECDIYVLLIGNRYGWKPFGKESITELEYDTATAAGKARLVYILDCDKEPETKDLVIKVQSERFRKVVKDASEFRTELRRSLEREIQKKQEEYFNNSETIYSNLINIEFPDRLVKAKLSIDKEAIRKYWGKIGKSFKWEPTLQDYAIGHLFSLDLKFPFDWYVHNGFVYTFHDLSDTQNPLSKLVDPTTISVMPCSELYSQSEDSLNVFKALLRKCLEKKLHDLHFKYFPSKKVYAFLPTMRDQNGNYVSLSLSWKKTVKNASRTVVDVKLKKGDETQVLKMKHLAFKTNFHFIDGCWYLAVKPDWLFTYDKFKVSQFGSESISFLKRKEKNEHVFNHLNFLLRVLQPKLEDSIVLEFQDYPYLKMRRLATIQSAPVVPDDIWLSKESNAKELSDKSGKVDLFNS